MSVGPYGIAVTPEIYIVRIYRRIPRSARQIAGLIETPGGSRAATFTSVEDLSAILGAPRAHLRRPVAPKVPPRK
jgi:hypothetical protein